MIFWVIAARRLVGPRQRLAAGPCRADADGIEQGDIAQLPQAGQALQDAAGALAHAARPAQAAWPGPAAANAERDRGVGECPSRLPAPCFP